jgi:small-conductance mechanosensitive channel
MVAFFLGFIVITELWGREELPSYLFVSWIRSMALVLTFMLFLYMIRGALERVFHLPLFKRATVLHSDIDTIIRHAARLTDVAICGLVLLPAILLIWGVYDSLEEAVKNLLGLGLTLGSIRISLGLVLTSAGILYGSFLASWILQRLLMDEALVKHRGERGARLSIGRLAHYIIISAGFLLALSTLGFEVTKITIVLSALGIGIGFGLQGMVNNFVSGLILLFERPVRVGDIIEMGEKWAEIKRIGLRATTVQTLDHADVIVPNADLVSNQVTNWTLSNRMARLCVPVGVAYGSDISLVIETLMACAKASSRVVEIPMPNVLFLNFGESSLDFELRVWVRDADFRLLAQSELNQEIDKKFREAKIEIAFPQRDLHLRSIDDSVIVRHAEKDR